MLHIILLILKIIGIVLLCIIGVIILVLIGILFVPVKYRIEVTRKEGEDEPPVDVRVKVTWLLHLLNILIRYPAETLVRVRLTIITVRKIPFQKDQDGQNDQDDDNTKNKLKKESKNKFKKRTKKETEKETKKETKKEAKKKKDSGNEKGIAGTDEQILLEEKGDIQKEKQGNAQRGLEKEKIPTVTIKAMHPDEEDDGIKEAPSFMDKLRALPVILRQIIDKIRGLFENIQYTIRRFCDRIKSILDNIQYYKKLVESDTFQNSFGLCKGELVTILKSLRPQKFEAGLVVGMDDPAATGEILAVCGMLYPLLGGHVDVAGDFEEKRIEGRVFIKGKIRVWTFLRAAVRIYFNKDIKRLLRLLKKEAA